MILATIGYEKASQPELIAALQAAGVRRIIDVRDVPNSRRAGFSKNVLAASLAAVGIDYVHLKALGTPKEGRLANRARQWERFWAIVERQLETPEAQHDLARAAALAGEVPSCLLCLEADPSICHRSAVAERLSRHGFTIRHLDPRALC
ncbi:MAG: DUF488 domain-containing protein [Rhodospirillales bacterium]|nr:DUF488 domain-containing protein [Rhodospirillales bacterium]